MKRLASLLLCLTILITPGCWNKVEINELAFIMAIGIDTAAGNSYLVSFQIAMPAGKGGEEAQGKTRNITLSFKSPNLREAAMQLNKTLDKAPFTGQTRLVVFSEGLARQGLIPVMDYLTRFYRLRRNVNLLVTKGRAADLFQTGPSGGDVPALNLAQRVEACNKWGLDEKITVGNFTTKLATGKIDPVIPGVEVLSGKTGEIRFPANQEELAVRELAVFRGDRLQGWLDEEETRGYMYTTGKALRGHVTVPFKEKESFQLFLVKPKISEKVAVEDGQPVIKLKVTSDADLVEAAASLDSSPEKWHQIGPDITAKAGEVVQGEILSAVKKAQETYRSDIFGFGQLIYRDKPDLWRQISAEWQEEFPRVKVEVEADICLRRSSATVNPPYPSEDKERLPLGE